MEPNPTGDDAACRYRNQYSKGRPMVAKIVLFVAVAIAVLVVAQRQDVVHEWGVAGSCEGVRAPVDDGNNRWYPCKEGLLTGYPSLIGDECRYEQRSAGYEYWSCPAPVTRFTSRS
jgi:hypothetical protein